MLIIKEPFPQYAVKAVRGLSKAVTAILFLCCIMVGLKADAQKKDTAQKEQVYLNADVLVNIKTDSGNLIKFINNAIFRQGTDTLYCDSLYEHDHKPSNIYEAFGDVRLVQQGGTHGTSDYLRYTAGNKEAFMSGHVNIIDSGNTLLCEELTYNLGTKVAVYDKGGTLHSDSTVVTSKTGVYNVKSKDARFKGDVVITDPQYKIKSQDLGYNTETKFETFFAHSVVVSDSGRSILETNSGTYDSKKGIAHDFSHASIWDDGQYINGDTLNYDKGTGFGLGVGHVISIDTAHHSILTCGRLEYYQKKRVLWATIKPVLQQVNGKDTIYMRADTFYSAPMIKIKKDTTKKNVLNSAKASEKIIDTIPPLKEEINKAYIKKIDSASEVFANQLGRKDENYRITSNSGYKIPGKEDTAKTVNAKKTKHKRGAELNMAIADTTSADSTAPLYFIGYHHVRIFSDSLQGKCDSVCYTRSDSTIRMIYAPIVWAHNSQITGDTILLHLDSNELRSLYVPSNAFVISQSGPEKAALFDQVQGKTLTAWFSKNTITSALVFPNAESLYYPVDGKGAYMGMNESKSERMYIFFEDQKIVSIKLKQQAQIKMTPMEKVDFPNAKLSRFKWLVNQRPKTKEELFK